MRISSSNWIELIKCPVAGLRLAHKFIVKNKQKYSISNVEFSISIPDIFPLTPSTEEIFLSVESCSIYFEFKITIGDPLSRINFRFCPFKSTSTAINLPANLKGIENLSLIFYRCYLYAF